MQGYLTRKTGRIREDVAMSLAQAGDKEPREWKRHYQAIISA